MSKEFVFEDVVITEEDITDEMIREECIAYLLNRISVSNYLRENITIAESERLNKWVQELDVDTATGLILGEADDAVTRKGILRKAAGAVGKAGKAVGKGAVAGAKVVGKGAAAGGKAVYGAGKAAGKAVGKGAVATGKYAKAHPVKTAAIAAGAIGVGLAGRALYKKLTDQCIKQCKGSSDTDCVVKCRQAAKAKVAARA